MRERLMFAIAVASAAAACGHGGSGGAPSHPPDPRAAVGGPAAGPAQYVVADPSARSNVVALPLGSAALGLIVDKTRIVVGRGEPHVGSDIPEAPLAGVRPIPSRLGGGFLFWTENDVYRADAFDAPLRPLARFADGIQNMSLAPKFALVRTGNGERWALGLPSGERVALEPLGASDVEGLDDGRALAFNDQGAAFSSMDGGAHWTDITTQIKSSPTRVAVIEGELWLYESSGGALRLEPDGQLSSFDKQPPEKPAEMRARDPRWRGTEAPLRVAFQTGASIDDSTAILVEQGDIVRVDVHTGEIVSVLGGKLPPDARCEAVPTANDVLFACVTRGSQQSSGPSAFVVSHTLSGDAPTIEQTFQTPAQFYASDDGGLAIAAPCGGVVANAQDHGVCVRQPGGVWQDSDVTALAGDGGASDVNIARWIPRADGHAVAVVLDPTPGIYDPRTGQLAAVEPGARDVLAQGLVPGYARYRKHMGGGIMASGMGVNLVDWSWSFSPSGSLRGWQRHGGIVEVSDEGKVTRSPYSFDLVAAGAFALGRTQDGRYYQSTDHGASWTEVAGPPSGASAGDLRACSTAGCDLGGFYRVGWAVRPPRVEAPLAPAKLAPAIRRTRPVEMSCRPAGAARVTVLPRTGSSPEDLALGNSRLPVAGERNELAFIRNTIPRSIVNPLHRVQSGDSDNPALRAMLTGFGTSKDGDAIEVMGPNKSASALRRNFWFVPPFDPSAPVKKAVFAMSEVLAAGRAAGLTNDEILSDDMTETGNVVPVTPADPAAAGELAFHNERGLLVRVRVNERVKIAMRPPQNEGVVVSGVALSNDESAFLEVESTGVGHVFKLNASGITDLFDISPTATDAMFYPANPDALAVGPRGELAIVRTGSGSDPASSNDPALLLVSAMPPVALAPWSSLRLADDPSCKEPGWRTTLQAIAPWIRVTTPELRAPDEMPMIARVKWSDKRVCLEGFEVKLPDVTVRAPGPTSSESLKVASWLVARGTTYARVAVSDGLEWRQPLECTVVPAPAKP